MAWLTGAASGYYIMGSLLGALVEVYLPDFSFNYWQQTLVMIGFVVFTVLFNTFFTRVLPMLERLSLVLHLAGWVIIIVCLWVMAEPKNSAHDVFVHVVNSGGWSNTGLSTLVGTVAVLYTQLGPDAAVHIGKQSSSH